MIRKIIIPLLLFTQIIVAQQIADIKLKLDKLSETEKGLNEVVDVNVSQVSLYDFITTLGNEHKLNVSIDEKLDQIVINNFYNVKVKDVLLFLVQKYNLEIKFLDRIIIFTQKKKEKKIKAKRKIDVGFNKEEELLSLNLQRDTLFQVAREITNITGKNIIVAPKIKDKIITGFVLNKETELALNMLSKANGLEITKDDKGYFFINEKKKEVVVSTNRFNSSSNNQRKNNKIDRKNDNLFVKLNPDGTIDVSADEVPLIDVIYNTALKANKNYFLYSKIDEGVKTSFSVKGLEFRGILNHVLKGSRYTFKEESDYFLIGEKNKEGLRVTELIRMKNRTVENVVTSIPSKLVAELEIKEFLDLNGIVVSGHFSAISELKNFLRKIDQSVPVIQIDVIIFEYEKSHEIQTGLQAGFDKNQTSSLTQSFPNADVRFNSSNLNKLINSFNGLGIVNLGKVPQNFYLGLKALEDNAIIKLESTPKISTLNGHEASIKIGSTSYYFEQTNRLLTSGANQDVLQSGQWRPTEANLSLKIKPFVSKDETVTLNVSVEKSDFTGRVGETAPPGKRTQQFESLIRVKNGEMILLGGLEEAENSNSGTGTPFLSRIPVIKWFFSGRRKKREKKKLHMFIKPTVYY